MSTYPWHEAFYKILNQVTELISYHSQDELFRFLQASHTAKVPESGKIVFSTHVQLYFLLMFCPILSKLVLTCLILSETDFDCLKIVKTL